MWNRFDKDRKLLDLYRNQNFEPNSGVTDINELRENVKKLTDSMVGQPHPIIKARAVEYLLDNSAIEVNPIDWFGFNFCGWIPGNSSDLTVASVPRKPLYYLCQNWLDELPKPEEYIKATANIFETGSGGYWCDYDHSVPDWDSVIGLGFGGILNRLQENCRLHQENGTLTPKMGTYYEASEIVYKAVIRIMHRFAACAEAHRDEDPKMPIVIEALSTIAEGTPKTLYQFLCLVYFYHIFQENLDMVQVRTLGNLDVDGYPFYVKDVQEGRLTKENAGELFQYFFEKYTLQGHLNSQPLYFGGFDENGETLINELSYIMLDAYDRSCIVNPKLFVKVMPNTPDEFLKKALDMIRRSHNAIVFINEELGMKISEKLGRTPEEARRLVGTGCNNFASRGKETTPEHMYVNLAKGVEFTFNDGKDFLTQAQVGCSTGDVSNFKTFDDFKQAYIAQIESLINRAFVISDFYDSHLLDINPTPMYSGTMPDSVRCGRDAYHDGVKYNNTVMFLSCHATAADSLMMVKKYVYDLKKVSIEELRAALLANWEGYEELREMLLNDPEKFGNDIDTVDSLAVELLNHFTSIVTSRKNKRGGQFVVNGESIWFAHYWAGQCGASPDGRARGDLLSKNMSASIGQDRRGITAHIKSVTKLDATNLAYGCPFDYVLHSSAVQGDDGLEAMLGLLRTFMKRGGYGYQGNVLDAKTLRDAQIHPEKYPNLQVRISGWSWFFTKMEKNFQDEFIRRAELGE